jgi:hypothetical protein
MLLAQAKPLQTRVPALGCIAAAKENPGPAQLLNDFKQLGVARTGRQ